MSTNSVDPRIEVLLENAENLPTMPAVAVEFVRLSQDETTSLEKFASVLSRDPALAANLLHFANSSLFCMGTEVTTLQRACMVLGLKTVKLVALSFSLVSTLQAGKESGPLIYEEFWKRSLVCAVAGRSWAMVAQSSLADEAFISGLLSHLGQLVLARCLPQEYSQILANTEGAWPTSQSEKRVLGFSSVDVGRALLESWSLPRLICYGVGYLRTPSDLPNDAPPQAGELVGIMHLAAACEELVVGEDKTASMEVVKSLAAERYQFSSDQVDTWLLGLERSVVDAAAVLNIGIKDGIDMQATLRQAQEQLVRESLGLAVEVQEFRVKLDQLQTDNSELATKANTDPLTELANRAYFEQTLANCLRQRLKGAIPKPIGILIIDIDHFKTVNDTYGHPVGDEALRVVGRILRKVTRDTDLPARLGGDEFSVVLPQTSTVGMKALGERIRTSIEAEVIEAERKHLSLKVSVGGACAREVETMEQVQQLIKLADACLLKAKSSGGNRFEFRETPERVRSGVGKKSI